MQILRRWRMREIYHTLLMVMAQALNFIFRIFERNLLIVSSLVLSLLARDSCVFINAALSSLIWVRD